MTRPNHARFLLPLGMLVATAHAAGQSAPRDVDPMRRYEQLVSAARAARADRDRVLTIARDEMRDQNGELSSERATELTHHEELVEIAESRLFAYCQMHRLPVPDLREAPAVESLTDRANRGDDPLHDSFRRAFDTVRASFRAEARRLALRIRLPAFRRPAADAREGRS